MLKIQPSCPEVDSMPTPAIDRFVAAYEASLPRALPPRNRKLFLWSWQASEQLLLAPLPGEIARELFETNVLAILLNVMIDDLADLASGSSELLEAALHILDEGEFEDLRVSAPYRPYLELLADLRRHLLTRLERWPAYEIWRDELLSFLGRFKEAMRRSAAWNRRWQGRKLKEVSTPIMPFEDFVDLMAPPIHSYIYGLFNVMQLGDAAKHQSSAITEILRLGEQFLAMSNWLATWRVELASRDFTSGLVVWALERGVFETNDLFDRHPDWLIERIDSQPFQPFIEGAMEERGAKLLEIGQRVDAFDVVAYRRSLNIVHSMHMNQREALKS